ncbi:unnamed protein product [Gulo gulo]|nr:unnamed protein product [Gulo gulo]
MRTSAT